jgi:hypothetical protein
MTAVFTLLAHFVVVSGGPRPPGTGSSRHSYQLAGRGDSGGLTVRMAGTGSP